MKVESVPVTISIGGKKLSIDGQKFKPAREVIYRFLVELSMEENPAAIILYESTKPGPKFNWDYESPDRNYLANAIAKALERQLQDKA